MTNSLRTKLQSVILQIQNLDAKLGRLEEGTAALAGAPANVRNRHLRAIRNLEAQLLDLNYLSLGLEERMFLYRTVEEY